MRFTSLKQFRKSKEWELCKRQIDLERQDKNGFIRCEKCGVVTKAFNPDPKADNRNALIHHHTIEMTIANMNNADISLNPERIQCLCVRCHNEHHQRFGFTPQQQVYLVTGSPCSGKTTFARENADDKSLIIDIDDVWEMVSKKPRYTKPDIYRRIVFNIYDELINQVKMRTGQWSSCFVIESQPLSTRRKDRAIYLGAELINIDTPKEQCLKNLYEDPKGRDVQTYERLINEYWDTFSE